MHVARGSVGPVRIAWTDTARGAPVPASVLVAQGDEQARRHASLTGDRADRFLAGRWLMAQLIAEIGGRAESTITSTCERCGASHGRPRVDGAAVAISVSYAGSLVFAAAVAHAHAVSVGIDAEIGTDAAAAPMTELARLFAPQEPPSLREWTEIEAALKADGRGLRVSPATVRIGGPVASVLPHARAVSIPGRADPIEVAPAPGLAGIVVSVAIAPAAAEER